MGLSYKFKTTGSKIDLTSTAVNPEAAPTSTPRQGGFTLRNRVNFTNVATANKTTFTMASQSTASSHAANVFRVLEVPYRTVINDVKIFAVKSETIPGHTLTASTHANAGASFLKSAIIGLDGELRTKPESSAAYAAASHLKLHATAINGAAAGGALGRIPLQNRTAAAVFEASLVLGVDTSLSTAAKAIRGRVLTEQAVTGSGIVLKGAPMYFPLGGYVYMALGPYDTATGSAGSATNNGATATFTGTWDFQAQCQYVPE